MDNPSSIKNPPAVQFYTGEDIKGVSFSDSCGYCDCTGFDNPAAAHRRAREESFE